MGRTRSPRNKRANGRSMSPQKTISRRKSRSPRTSIGTPVIHGFVNNLQTHSQVNVYTSDQENSQHHRANTYNSSQPVANIRSSFYDTTGRLSKSFEHNTVPRPSQPSFSRYNESFGSNTDTYNNEEEDPFTNQPQTPLRHQASVGVIPSGTGRPTRAVYPDSSSPTVYNNSNTVRKPKRTNELISNDYPYSNGATVPHIQGVPVQGVDAFALKEAARALERVLRKMVLRFGKVPVPLLSHLIEEICGRYVDNNHGIEWLRERLWLKARSNTSTWKHRTLERMKEWVYHRLERDQQGNQSTGKVMLADITDPETLLSAFETFYSTSDAETAFAWGAKQVMFHERLPSHQLDSASSADGPALPPGPFWIRFWFLHLAVQTKLYCDRERDHRCLHGLTKDELLNWYDSFPRHHYPEILHTHFKDKTIFLRRNQRRTEQTPIGDQALGQMRATLVLPSAIIAQDPNIDPQLSIGYKKRGQVELVNTQDNVSTQALSTQAFTQDGHGEDETDEL